MTSNSPFRQLLKNPGFTAVAVLTLALVPQQRVLAPQSDQVPGGEENEQ